MQAIRACLTILCCLLLLSCSSEQNLREKVKNWDPYHYTVQHGDTLYSIAWRYDLDFKILAKWNGIRSPYLIFPGQRLDMKGPGKERQKNYLFGSIENSDSEKDLAESPDYSDPSNIPEPPPVNTLSSSSIPPANKPLISTSRKPDKSSVSRKIPEKRLASATKKRSMSMTYKAKVTWSWPLKGKLFSTFAANNTDRKGIDIIGKNDEKIRAAAQGVVVYSGSGLISYGNLIIVKHNDRFLSAYAHNKSLLVKEGERVTRGQTIAIIGKKPNVTNLLHFEIRKDGKPVNPLVYLP